MVVDNNGICNGMYGVFIYGRIFAFSVIAGVLTDTSDCAFVILSVLKCERPVVRISDIFFYFVCYLVCYNYLEN